MIGISHWGMFRDAPQTFCIPKGFKLSKEDWAELRKPNGILEIIPLAKNEAQPVYFMPTDSGDCA